MASQRAKCKHCERTIQIQSRGLCFRCHHQYEIRVQYPVTRVRAFKYHDDEPTEAELEVIIAEQLKPENLPWFWEHDAMANGLRDRKGRTATPIRLLDRTG